MSSVTIQISHLTIEYIPHIVHFGVVTCEQKQPTFRYTEGRRKDIVWAQREGEGERELGEEDRKPHLLESKIKELSLIQC